MWDKVTKISHPIPQRAYDPNYPASIQQFMTDFDMQEHFSMVLSTVPIEQDYLSLRNYQNKHWATNIAKSAKEAIMEKDFVKAHKICDSALNIDSECIDALIGKGAAYVYVEKYIEACQYFKKALQVHPEHKVAQKYLAAAEKKMRELHEERQMLERGEFLMPMDTTPSAGRLMYGLDPNVKTALEPVTDHFYQPRKKYK